MDLSPPFLRLILLHLTLDKICLKRKLLDEDASEEELSEHILYYERLCSSNTASTEVARTEALRFAGLCTALYSLPSSVISSTSHESDRTRLVHTSESSLVFVSLEKANLDIIAVAEIHKNSDITRRATPDAACRLLSSSHNLFCLTRGGIDRRLSQSSSNYLSSKSACKYPGMDTLYKLRKQLRRKSGAGSDQKTFAALKKLYRKLPMFSLRKDISIHYNTFLSNLARMAAENSALCRSVSSVIGVSPITRPGPGSCSAKCLPTPLNPMVRKTLSKTLGELFGKLEQNIEGVSLFINNQCVETQARTGHDSISIGTSTALYQFMKSTKTKLPRSESSSNESNETFQGPGGQLAWLPKVYLPSSFSTNDVQRVFLLYLCELEMLAFIRVNELLEAKDSYQSVLETMKTRASDVFQAVLPSKYSFNTVSWKSEGQEIVIVDHARCSAVLYNSKHIACLEDLRNKPNCSTLSMHVKGLTTRVAALSSAYPIDAKQLFTTSLSLPSILAFDDSLSQAHSFRNQYRLPVFESCTALDNSWMYTCVSGKIDVHILFDPSVHVTVADVRRSADVIIKCFTEC